MRIFRLAAALALLASPALAQNGAVTNHAFPIGKGPGVTGFTSLLCAAGQLPIGQTGADPLCLAPSGDLTMGAGGFFAIGATKVTSVMLNADVFSTAHSWSGGQTFAAPNLGTPASGILTNTTGLPISTGVSGLGTGVATFLATPSSANLRAALTDEVGTGAAYFVGGALGTPASATLTNGTGLPLTGLTTQSANTIVANATAGSASPTAVAMPSCSGANQAVNWTSGTGPGCATIAGSGGAWSNTRLAKTAAYTVASGDAGSTIALGGGTPFAVTFDAPSGYGATYANLVLNEDQISSGSAAGKLIIPMFGTSATSQTIGTGNLTFTTQSGLPFVPYATVSPAFNTSQRYRVYSLANHANYMSGTVVSYSGTSLVFASDTIGGSGTFTDWQIAPEIRLWPGQSRWIFNQNNVWILDAPKRWKQPGETELCVDVGGSDSNDGLGTTAATRCLRHIAYAAALIYQEWDANHFPPDIGLYNGPFDEMVNIRGQMVGYNFINFNTRVNNVWQNSNLSATTSAAACVSVGDYAIARFVAQFGAPQIWKCNQANFLGSGAIYGHQQATADVVGSHNFQFGGSNDAAVFADGELRATIAGDTTGGLAAGLTLGSGSTSSGNSFVRCAGPCRITTGGTLAWNTGTTSLGAMYVLKSGALISHSANFGGTPGTIGTAIINGGGATLLANGLTLPGGAPTPSGGTTAGGGTYCATGC